MYCPRCSQQQVSEEMRFCSRCGFPLSAVRELVAAGGVVDEAVAHAGQSARRPRSLRAGAWLMLAALVAVPVVGVLTAMDDDFAILALPMVLSLITGFVLMVYGVFFAEKRARRLKEAASQAQAVPSMRQQRELPPSRVAPIESLRVPRVDTAKMGRPPSVTEGTTKLLDEGE